MNVDVLQRWWGELAYLMSPIARIELAYSSALHPNLDQTARYGNSQPYFNFSRPLPSQSSISRSNPRHPLSHSHHNHHNRDSHNDGRHETPNNAQPAPQRRRLSRIPLPNLSHNNNNLSKRPHRSPRKRRAPQRCNNRSHSKARNGRQWYELPNKNSFPR